MKSNLDIKINSSESNLLELLRSSILENNLFKFSKICDEGISDDLINEDSFSQLEKIYISLNETLSDIQKNKTIVFKDHEKDRYLSIFCEKILISFKKIDIPHDFLSKLIRPCFRSASHISSSITKVEGLDILKNLYNTIEAQYKLNCNINIIKYCTEFFEIIKLGEDNFLEGKSYSLDANPIETYHKTIDLLDNMVNFLSDYEDTGAEDTEELRVEMTQFMDKCHVYYALYQENIHVDIQLGSKYRKEVFFDETNNEDAEDNLSLCDMVKLNTISVYLNEALLLQSENKEKREAGLSKLKKQFDEDKCLSILNNLLKTAEENSPLLANTILLITTCCYLEWIKEDELTDSDYLIKNTLEDTLSSDMSFHALYALNQRNLPVFFHIMALCSQDRDINESECEDIKPITLDTLYNTYKILSNIKNEKLENLLSLYDLYKESNFGIAMWMKELYFFKIMHFTYDKKGMRHFKTISNELKEHLEDVLKHSKSDAHLSDNSKYINHAYFLIKLFLTRTMGNLREMLDVRNETKLPETKKTTICMQYQGLMSIFEQLYDIESKPDIDQAENLIEILDNFYDNSINLLKSDKNIKTFEIICSEYIKDCFNTIKDEKYCANKLIDIYKKISKNDNYFSLKNRYILSKNILLIANSKEKSFILNDKLLSLIENSYVKLAYYHINSIINKTKAFEILDELQLHYFLQTRLAKKEKFPEKKYFDLYVKIFEIIQNSFLIQSRFPFEANYSSMYDQRQRLIGNMEKNVLLELSREIEKNTKNREEDMYYQNIFEFIEQNLRIGNSLDYINHHQNNVSNLNEVANVRFEIYQELSRYPMNRYKTMLNDKNIGHLIEQTLKVLPFLRKNNAALCYTYQILNILNNNEFNNKISAHSGTEKLIKLWEVIESQLNLVGLDQMKSDPKLSILEHYFNSINEIYALSCFYYLEAEGNAKIDVNIDITITHFKQALQELKLLEPNNSAFIARMYLLNYEMKKLETAISESKYNELNEIFNLLSDTNDQVIDALTTKNKNSKNFLLLAKTYDELSPSTALIMREMYFHNILENYKNKNNIRDFIQVSYELKSYLNYLKLMLRVDTIKTFNSIVESERLPKRIQKLSKTLLLRFDKENNQIFIMNSLDEGLHFTDYKKMCIQSIGKLYAQFLANITGLLPIHSSCNNRKISRIFSLLEKEFEEIFVLCPESLKIELKKDFNLFLFNHKQFSEFSEYASQAILYLSEFEALFKIDSKEQIKPSTHLLQLNRPNISKKESKRAELELLAEEKNNKKSKPKKKLQPVKKTASQLPKKPETINATVKKNASVEKVPAKEEAKQPQPKQAPKQPQPKQVLKQAQPKQAPKQPQPKQVLKQPQPKQVLKQAQPKQAPKQPQPKQAPKQPQPKNMLEINVINQTTDDKQELAVFYNKHSDFIINETHNSIEAPNNTEKYLNQKYSPHFFTEVIPIKPIESVSLLDINKKVPFEIHVIENIPNHILPIFDLFKKNNIELLTYGGFNRDRMHNKLENDIDLMCFVYGDDLKATRDNFLTFIRLKSEGSSCFNVDGDFYTFKSSQQLNFLIRVKVITKEGYEKSIDITFKSIKDKYNVTDFTFNATIGILKGNKIHVFTYHEIFKTHIFEKQLISIDEYEGLTNQKNMLNASRNLRALRFIFLDLYHDQKNYKLALVNAVKKERDTEVLQAWENECKSLDLLDNYKYIYKLFSKYPLDQALTCLEGFSLLHVFFPNYEKKLSVNLPNFILDNFNATVYHLCISALNPLKVLNDCTNAFPLKSFDKEEVSKKINHVVQKKSLNPNANSYKPTSN